MSRRVLHVAQPTDAGVPRVATDLAADQARRGWDVTLACPPDGPVLGWLAGTSVRHQPWRASRAPGLSVAAEARALARIVAAVDPDVVHLHSSKAGLAGRLAVRGRRPTVFQPHAWSFDAVTGPMRAASLAWERYATRWTGLVLCVSEAERARGEASGVRARYAVVPNGVDLAAFPPVDASAREGARKSLGLGSRPVVVCVGRLARQKGQDLLLDAWPAVRAAVPDATLELVGDGPDAPALAARQVAGVGLHGRRDDVALWLAAADVVAFPSRWEGMSLALLEAGARGCSVVATDVPGVRESLPAGHAGVVAPAAPGALAAAIVTRLEDADLRSAEGAATAAHVHARHGLDTACTGVAAAYEGLLVTR